MPVVIHESDHSLGLANRILARWHTDGTPALQEFTLTVTPDRQSLHW